ncbi:membrane protein [Bacteroidales bacterium]|nr:membrane protein [Bacteroidales bacterium]
MKLDMKLFIKSGLACCRLCIIVLSLLLVSLHTYGQKDIAHKKGDFFVYWGWNLDAYTHSDIRFWGNDYDFMLHDVNASDRQSRMNYHNYLQPNRVTIPQTNFRLGYFIKDNLALSFGVDHMKYVMEKDQVVRAVGYNNRPGYEQIGDRDLKLTEDFLQFEHTDGLNYINFEIENYKNLYTKDFFKLNALVGGGAGFLLPRTNATLMDFERHDDFHLAGWGIAAKIGIEFSFWNVFSLRSEGKQGYIDMPNIRTTKFKEDKASQHFFFAQLNYTLGFNWRF